MRSQLVVFFLMLASALQGQELKHTWLLPSDTLNRKRIMLVGGTAIGGYTVAMVGLNELWYKDYPRSSFHFFDDNEAWLQMDKAGHALTAYQLSRYGYESFKWTGLSEKNAVLTGSAFSLLFQTTIEVLDGFSDEWGFSKGDALANVSGTVLFAGQQLVWKEQRIALKFSYTPSNYTDYSGDVLGVNHAERIIKDYNGQTIWLSVNPSSFSQKKGPLPWLNLAIGYGANGMIGGTDNPFANPEGIPLPNFDRYRQFYLSLDVDLTRIPAKSPLLKTVFKTFGFVKIPAPTLELSQDKLSWHWIYF